MLITNERHKKENWFVFRMLLIVLVGWALILWAGTSLLRTPSKNDSPTSDGYTNYSVFKENAQHDYMQILTVGWTPSMEVPDDYFYLVVNRRQAITAYHTFAIKGLGLDARTGVGCYDAWAFDGRKDVEGWGEAFCIAESDVQWLFSVGRAYYTAFRTY